MAERSSSAAYVEHASARRARGCRHAPVEGGRLCRGGNHDFGLRRGYRIGSARSGRAAGRGRASRSGGTARTSRTSRPDGGTRSIGTPGAARSAGSGRVARSPRAAGAFRSARNARFIRGTGSSGRTNRCRTRSAGTAWPGRTAGRERRARRRHGHPLSRLRRRRLLLHTGGNRHLRRLSRRFSHPLGREGGALREPRRRSTVDADGAVLRDAVVRSVAPFDLDPLYP
jgi:hypothetical protein